MNSQKSNKKRLFLISLLGLMTSLVFGINSPVKELQSKAGTKTFYKENQSSDFSSILKYLDEDDYEKSKVLVDESEFETDLEFDCSQHFNHFKILGILDQKSKKPVKLFHFVSLHYKIPLYNLFCKWKLDLN